MILYVLSEYPLSVKTIKTGIVMIHTNLRIVVTTDE